MANPPRKCHSGEVYHSTEPPTFRRKNRTSRIALAVPNRWAYQGRLDMYFDTVALAPLMLYLRCSDVLQQLFRNVNFVAAKYRCRLQRADGSTCKDSVNLLFFIRTGSK